jgi:hydrogenase maturation protease
LSGSEAAPGRLTTLVIGVGNEYRRDDAVGLVAARRLSETATETVRVLEESGEAASLIESWQGADSVILIDAVHSGASPGTIHRLDAHAGPIAREFFRFSTHAIGLAEAVELARALGRLPPRLVIYGIEGKSFEAGEGLSPEVEAAVGELVERVLAEVG